MNPLVLAFLSVFVLSSSVRAQVKSVPSDSLKDLKEKYAKGGQKPALLAPAARTASPRPQLWARLSKGEDGYYAFEHVVKNLKWAGKNLAALTDYIRPWREGEAPAEGKDAVWAYEVLTLESAAARELIAALDAAFAKGIPRDPLDPNKLRPRPAMYVSRAVLASAVRSPDMVLVQVASAQMNVLGHSAALINFKRLNPPDAEAEAKIEGWLADAREQLARAEKPAGE